MQLPNLLFLKRKNKNMKINLQTSLLVKPAEPTWNGLLPLSELDQVSGNYFVPLIYIYKPPQNCLPAPDAIFQVFKSSLSKVLVAFYPLAGRVSPMATQGRLHVECNGMGVLLTQASSEATWDELKETDYDQLCPSIDDTIPLWQLPLLAVRITAFNDGGICLGVTMWHPMADGLSASHFFTEWARIARGEALQSQPFIDRKLMCVVGGEPMQPRPVEFDKPPVLVGELGCEKVTNKATRKAFLKLSKTQVEILKISANKGNLGAGKRGFSRFESITAHIWRCTCKARGHKTDQLTRLTTSIDIRQRMQPPLPKTYLGNAVLDVAALDYAGDLMSKPLSYGASRIREAIKKVTPDYIDQTIGFLRGVNDLSSVHMFDSICSTDAGEEKGVFTGNPNLGVASWLSLQFQGLDFGWGKEFFMAPVSENCDGDFLVLPDGHDCKGSVVIVMCLQDAHMEAFKKFFYEDINGI